MKNLLVILIGISFFSFSVFSFNYLKVYEKKINKELKKIFETDDISIEYVNSVELSELGQYNRFYKLNSGDKLVGYANINKVNACREGGCQIFNPLSQGRYDHFYYMAVFDTDFTIIKVSVLDYQSDYGYEICSRNWLKQFIGKKDQAFEYNKNVDAISGATVSVHSIIDEMNLLKAELNKFFTQCD